MAVNLLRRLLVPLALGLAATACADDDPAPTCTDACAVAEAFDCEGAVVTQCVRGADGCLEVQDAEDCAGIGQVCEAGSCRMGCIDDCETEGARRCSGAQLEACEVQADGCRAWSSITDCAASGQVCDDTGAEPMCVCMDRCPAADGERCEGSIAQRCEVAADGCLDWAAGEDCADSGRLCDDAGGSATCVCNDTCAAGEGRCVGTRIERCTADPDGCLDYALELDCADAQELCEEGAGGPMCVVDCALRGPAAPNAPTPSDGASQISVTSTSVDWADSAGADGYDVSFGTTCPPPAWPDAADQAVTASELGGLTLASGTTYCWRVVATNALGCATPGPDWSFSTTCEDPVVGPPQVTSTGGLLTAPSGTYRLSFDEPVTVPSGALTWTAITGSGTLGAITRVDDRNFDVAYQGVAPNDAYTLRIGTAVTDGCGVSLAAPVNLSFQVPGPVGESCASPQPLAVDVQSYLTGTFSNPPIAGTSCGGTPPNGVWYTFSPAVTGAYYVSAANNRPPGSDSVLAIFDSPSCQPYGAELYCQVGPNQGQTTTVNLTAGTTYLMLFHTTSTARALFNPQAMVIRPVVDPGETCGAPVDLTNASFPLTLPGIYSGDATGGSCDTSANNVAWFRWDASSSGNHTFTASNSTQGLGTLRVAVFNGLGCAPYGAQVGCAGGGSGFNTSLTVNLTSGTSYVVAVYTSGGARPNVDPTITVTAPP